VALMTRVVTPRLSGLLRRLLYADRS
jgi:hypothetical protein